MVRLTNYLTILFNYIYYQLLFNYIYYQFQPLVIIVLFIPSNTENYQTPRIVLAKGKLYGTKVTQNRKNSLTVCVNNKTKKKNLSVSNRNKVKPFR